MHQSSQPHVAIVTQATPPASPHWTAYVSAFAIPLIAAIAATIAYQQWRTARNKLKLDLFERRMEIYEAARELLGNVARTGNTTLEKQFEFLSKTRSAKWLFGPEVVEYFDHLWERTIDLEMHQSIVSKSERNDPERAMHIKLKSEALKHLMAQYKVLDQKCAPYLELRH